MICPEYTGVVTVKKNKIGRYQDATRFRKLVKTTCGKKRKKAEITEAGIPNQNSGKIIPLKISDPQLLPKHFVLKITYTSIVNAIKKIAVIKFNFLLVIMFFIL
jgi:hypothetical protein